MQYRADLLLSHSYSRSYIRPATFHGVQCDISELYFENFLTGLSHFDTFGAT